MNLPYNAPLKSASTTGALFRVAVTYRPHSTTVEITGPRMHHIHILSPHTRDREVGALIEGTGWLALGERTETDQGWTQLIAPII